MDSASKTDTVSAPLPETTSGPMLVRMLGVVPSEESEGGQGSYGLLEGGCLEGRNQKFLSSGEEEDCL